MNKKTTLLLVLLVGAIGTSQAQLGKLKGMLGKKKESTTEAKKESATETKKDSDKEVKKESTTEINKAESSSLSDSSEVDDVESVSTENIPAKKEAWRASFDREINWFNLTSLGTVVVSADDALYGIEPVSGKINWKNEGLKKLSKANYTALNGSPFIAIFEGGLFNMQQTIIDVSDGRIVCNTKNLGLKYATKRLSVPNMGAVLFGGSDAKGQALMLVTLKDGQKQWSVNKVFEKAAEQLVSEPLLTTKGLLIATTHRVYMLDQNNGNVIYKLDYTTKIDEPLAGQKVETEDKESTLANAPKKPSLLKRLSPLSGALGTLDAVSQVGNGAQKDMFAASMSTIYARFVTVDDKIAYFYNNQTITGIDIASGTILWPKTKLSDPIANVLFDDNGILVATDDKKSELMLFDYQNGDMKWPAPLKLSGRISGIKLTGTKLAVGSAKNNGRNMVSIVDIITGKPVSNAGLKVDGIITDLRMIENVGLMYRTTEETNIQDINTGKDQWAKSIKYKTGGLGVDKGDLTYFTANNSIYQINHNTGEHKLLASQKFGNKEVVKAIELKENGVLISSDQNLALFDFNGKLIYHVYHAAPGATTFNKVLSGVAMAVSMANSASEGMQAGAAGYGTTSYNSHMANADRWGDVASGAMSTFRQRFNASDNAKNYVLMLTKVKTLGDNGIGLVRVNKANGKVEGKVVIDDRKPDYLFDEIDNVLFYKDSNRKIIAYNFVK